MDDYEMDFDLSCPKCGHSPLHWRRCIHGCDEGYFDEYDDDPINSPIPGLEFTECPECKGTGIERWCPKCGKDLSGVHLKEFDEEHK